MSRRSTAAFRMHLCVSAGYLLLSSCSEPHAGGGQCIRGAADPLYNGSDVPPEAWRARADAWAIGAIEGEGGTLYCSGVAVHPQWVLTAAHCADEELFLRLGTAEASTIVALGRAVAHPTEDLALLEILEPNEALDAGFRPLALRDTPVTLDHIGSRVLLAGAGSNEAHKRGELRFVEEPIVAVDANTLSVDGRGQSGACVGDSGGPLLGKNERQDAEIIGILRDGASNCLGVDHYLRVDVFYDWITETLDESALPDCRD